MTALSSVRAGLTPNLGSRTQTQAPALNGQAAFFRTAMGQSQAAEKPVAATAPVAPRVEMSKPEVALNEDGMPSRLLRPGSLLDIRV